MNYPISDVSMWQLQSIESKFDNEWINHGRSWTSIEAARRYRDDRKTRGVKFRIVQVRTTETVVEINGKAIPNER